MADTRISEVETTLAPLVLKLCMVIYIFEKCATFVEGSFSDCKTWRIREVCIYLSVLWRRQMTR